MDFFKKTVELAESLMDSVVAAKEKMETGRVYSRKEAKGATGEISVSVSAHGTGEVLVTLGRAVNSYPAQAAVSGQEFKRGEMVRIADVGTAVMFVEKLAACVPNEPQPLVSAPSNEVPVAASTKKKRK
jgi:hypothetical protein